MFFSGFEHQPLGLSGLMDKIIVFMRAAHSGAKVRAVQECQNQQSVKASDDSEPMPNFQALKK